MSTEPLGADMNIVQVAALGTQTRVTIGRILNTPVVTIARTPVTVATLALFALMVCLTFVLARWARQGTRRVFALRGAAPDPATISLVARLVHYTVVLLGLGVALATLGIDLGALFTAGAFFAVALGFAVQTLAQNFVAGLMLLTDRTIKTGDVLEVEGRVVRVSHLGLRATVARTRDEEDLIIPNSVLVQNTVTNYTLRDSTYRLRAVVGVAYDSDVAAVMRVLHEAARALPDRLETQEPRVLLTEFADSALLFEVSVWVQDPWHARLTKSALNEAIWRALKDAEITIPFPRRDVHVIEAAPAGNGTRRLSKLTSGHAAE